jgi:hypothetical protein
MPDMIPLDRLAQPTASQFAPYAAAAKPVLVANAVQHWKALDTWTPSNLMARAGTAQVPVVSVAEGSPDGKFFYGNDGVGTVRLADCLPLLSGAPARVYMAGVPISQYLPMLAADLAPLEFLSESKQRHRQMWISGKGSKSPLHYDLDDNIHVVVSGRKRFYLFAYTETAKLYPCGKLSKTPHYSMVDAQDPDLQRFPRFRSAAGYDVTLTRGDMVYIPQGCWHQVITEEPSIAINFWIGKRLFQRAMWRTLISLAGRALVEKASMPRRIVEASTRRLRAMSD